MNNSTETIIEYFLSAVWIIATTFINIITPLSGSTTVNPVVAYFTDPQRAIGIGALMFFFSGLHRLFLFRKELFLDTRNFHIIKAALPFSLVGALLGGSFVSLVSARFLAGMVIIATLYYISKVIYQLYHHHDAKVTPHKKKHLAAIALLSGLLQGGGMPGSEIRTNYLRTVLNEISVRAVSFAIGTATFFVSGVTILFYSRMHFSDVFFVLIILPLLILAQHYGKKILHKIDDRYAKLIAISISLIGVVLLTIKYFL